MPRSPKGVVTRSPPEWNLQNMYWGWYNTSGPGTNQILGVVLYNNTTNSTFVVWHAATDTISENYTATNVVGASVAMAMGKGVPNHQLSTPGTVQYALAVPGQTGLGIMYSYGPNTVPSAYTNLVSIGCQIGTQWQAGWHWPHEWPIAVIPPGFGFALHIYGGSNELSSFSDFTFGFEAVSQPYP